MRDVGARRGVCAVVVAMGLAAGCGSNVNVEPAGTAGSTGEGGTAGGGGSSTSPTTTSGGAGGGTGGTTAPGCSSKADCAGDPKGPFCNTETGECASCLVVENPAEDCGIGLWCDAEKGQCEVGCTADVDCPNDAKPLCDVATKTCVGCLSDASCALGALCVNDVCVPGCTVDHPCPTGLTCCGSTCLDLATDEQNCGFCDQVCPSLPNVQMVCANGQCVMGPCTGVFADCNGDVTDGCETNTLIDGPCVCTPGESQACYLGPPGTEGVGPCKAGKRECHLSGVFWGPCEGAVLPAPDVCGNAVDDDCNGQTDENVDGDLDGWGVCDGDCNDSNSLINPGALEITYTLVDDDGNVFTPPVPVEGGNLVDDDCDPATADDVTPPACSAGALTSGVTALDLAHALDLCQTAVADAPKPEKRWGVLSADLVRVDGAALDAAQLADFQNVQTAVLTDYGVIVPKRGPTFVGLSTGKMRDEGDPGHVPPSPGTDLGWAGSPPAAYLAANGGALPGSLGCNGACPGGTGAHDGVAVRLVIRVPSNVKGFSMDYRLFSAEYPGVCAGKNDFFLARLTSVSPGVPADKNVARDGLGNPLSASNAFFDVCSPAGCFTCPKGAGDLAGTGMPGGTSWLTTDVPLQPSETATLELSVFDVSDGAGDTVVLVDDFRWVQHNPLIPPHP